MTTGKILGARDDLMSMMGEGIHTAFRKGIDDPKAHEMWQAIQDLPDDLWNQALEYCVWGMEYSGFLKWEEQE